MMVAASSQTMLYVVLSLILLTGEHTSLAFQSKSTPFHRASWTRSSPIPKATKSVASPGTRSANTKLGVWSEALSAIDTFYQTAPYAAGALTCGTKASAADYVAQKRQDRNLNQQDRVFEIARNVAFLVYGAVYQGVAQEYIYNHCYATWFGASSHPIVVLQKVCFDLFVQTTLVTLPLAYLTKAIIFRYSLVEGLRRYKDDVLHNGLLKKYFTLWGPVQCLTFSIVPEHLRISFIAAVSFFWLIILSTISAKADAKVAPKVAPKPVLILKKEELVFAQAEQTLAMANATTTSG